MRVNRMGVATPTTTSRSIGLFALAALLLGAGVGAFCQTAQAGYSGDLITITAANENGIAHRVFPLPELPPQAEVPARIRHMLQERFELRTDQGDLIGAIEEMEVELIGDPVVNISFTATAGSLDTTFMLSSAVLSFPTLTNPPALADAELTLTDTGSDGASVGVVAPNDGLFKALYNGSTEYAELLGSTGISGGSTTIMGDTSSSIAGSVSSIQAVWTFELSATDQASGSGVFEVVVPEPSTLLLASCGLVMSAFCFGRRRRQHR